MKLFTKPFSVLTQAKNFIDVLLTDNTDQVIYVVRAAQDFAGPMVEIDRVTAPPGKVAAGMTRAELAPIIGQSSGTRSRGFSWVFKPSLYGLIDNRMFFLQLEKRTAVTGSGVGSSPGAGNTWTDVTKDFDALGIVAGDVLVVESGPEAGDYTVQAALNNDITTVEAFGGADAGARYTVYHAEPYRNAWYVIPPPFWDHGKPTLIFEGTAPQAALADARVVVFPKRFNELHVYNLDGANDVKYAFDEDGPEITLAAGKETTQLSLSATTMTFRSTGAGGGAFRVIAAAQQPNF